MKPSQGRALRLLNDGFPVESKIDLVNWWAQKRLGAMLPWALKRWMKLPLLG